MNKPIVIEQAFDQPVERIWHAITEVDQMTQWFFENIPAFKPEEGFETQFMVRTPDREFLHLWKLTEVVPHQIIIYSWKYDGYPGDSFVHFELFERDDATLLRVTHEVIEDFPQDIPEFNWESGREGWIYFIQKRLKAYLDG